MRAVVPGQVHAVPVERQSRMSASVAGRSWQNRADGDGGTDGRARGRVTWHRSGLSVPGCLPGPPTASHSCVPWGICRALQHPPAGSIRLCRVGNC